MPRHFLTLKAAQIKVDEKYGEGTFKLLTFTSSHEPCQIECKVHGVVEVSTFNNFLRASRFGCPKCAEDSRRCRLKVFLKSAGIKRRERFTLVKSLLTLSQQPLSDAEFGKKARELAKEFLNG